ncbi:MAG: serine hydrolase [Croceivirga sp.]
MNIVNSSSITRIKLFLILAVIPLFNSWSQSDTRLRGIEKQLNKILKTTKAPGFAVAVVQGKRTLYAKGFGYQDVENKIPMDANTLLAIGSCSKAFTSSILGQLRDEGELSFDDSPIDYIPELRFYNNELNNNVNIRDLMSHQTGIPRHDFSWYLFPTFNRDSLIGRIKHHEPFTGLRQKWYYNNFMFLTQGVIAERITGKSWEDNIKERFFEPLGMKRSNVSIKELENSSNAALGYELYKDSVLRKMDYYKIAAMAPAGSINSSVNEMAKWLKVWINKGKYNNEQLLPETYVNEAQSSQAVMGSGLPEEGHPDQYLANYGYGWMISSYKGHYRVEHGGNIDGFAASTAFFPTDSLGIVVLANQNGSAVPYMVRNTIADKMLKVKSTDWVDDFLVRKEKMKEAKESQEKSDSTTTQKTNPSHPIASYTGRYNHPGYGTFSIDIQADSLIASFKLKKYYLKHRHYDVFEPIEITERGIDTTETSPIKFNFRTNESGDISGLESKIEFALDHPLEFKRQPKLIDISAVDINMYVGEYDIGGFGIKIYTKQDGQLYMFVTGQPEYTLLPLEEHLFIIKDLEGFKVKFKSPKNGVMMEAISMQPNGNFTAKRKE